MQLYIANATRQVQDFHYRLPEISQVRQQKIPIGGQIKISGDLRQVDIDAIIRQHAKYGMINADEIQSGRAFAPLCYQVDKPISPIKIEMLANRNVGVLNDRGKEQRQNAAIVMATNLGANMREIGAGGDLESVTVETVEDDNPAARNRRAETGGERITETTVVTPEGKGPRAPEQPRETLRSRAGKKRR